MAWFKKSRKPMESSPAKASKIPEGLWVKALGIANERLMRPMRATVHHRIGSVTKTFIGTLLMQLVGDHKLSLDDTIDQYVKVVPN